jgi:hypothetical protein
MDTPMSLLATLLALLGSPTHDEVRGRYEAVTESEYAIEVTLEKDGKAEVVFRSWEPETGAEDYEERLLGTWSLKGAELEVSLKPYGSVRYAVAPCLSHEEFGGSGCSFGLRPLSSALPEDYGLQRFGLWRAETLGVGP